MTYRRHVAPATFTSPENSSWPGSRIPTGTSTPSSVHFDAADYRKRRLFSTRSNCSCDDGDPITIADHVPLLTTATATGQSPAYPPSSKWQPLSEMPVSPFQLLPLISEAGDAIPCLPRMTQEPSCFSKEPSVSITVSSSLFTTSTETPCSRTPPSFSRRALQFRGSIAISQVLFGSFLSTSTVQPLGTSNCT